jgi:hypothetical protein
VPPQPQCIPRRACYVPVAFEIGREAARVVAVFFLGSKTPQRRAAQGSGRVGRAGRQGSGATWILCGRNPGPAALSCTLGAGFPHAPGNTRLRVSCSYIACRRWLGSCSNAILLKRSGLPREYVLPLPKRLVFPVLLEFLADDCAGVDEVSKGAARDGPAGLWSPPFHCTTRTSCQWRTATGSAHGGIQPVPLAPA